MRNRAVFLDRDGTLIKDKRYAFAPGEIEFLPGVIDGLKKLRDAGFLLIVITNQSGVARGYFTEDDVKAFHTALLKRLARSGVLLDAVYYCPHYLHGTVKKYAVDCSCRKPKTGLFYAAADDHAIDLSSSYAVGDSQRDCSICLETQCRGCVIDGGRGAKDAFRHFENFTQCVEYILNGDVTGSKI